MAKAEPLGLTEAMVLACSKDEFEGLLTDLGVPIVQKLLLRNCYQSATSR